LEKLGVVAFSYCRESLATARREGTNLAIQIKECSKWQIICVDPEHLRDKEWRVIAESPIFRAHYLFTVIDEAHLIKLWGAEFRLVFKLIGLWVRGCLPPRSVVALSATLAPGTDTTAVCESLGFYSKSFHLIRRSNERLNIQFSMQVLTHGLAGYDFPDLFPFLSSERKLVIHCATLDLVFRVYVYIWHLQHPTADKMRRVRMYTSLCSAEYNQETLRLIDEDPYCQIIIATVALANRINARWIQDSLYFGFNSTVDLLLQGLGRAGRAEDSIAQGVTFVQPSMMAAAAKQLKGTITTRS
jgi:superfamily II DNA helicase RecQ